MPIRVTYLIFALFWALSLGEAYGQVGFFSKVKKMPCSHQFDSDESCEHPVSTKKRRIKEHWIAFSDSDENAGYADPFGRKELTKLKFMEPLVVLKERNNYCKVIAYDPEVLKGSNPVSGLMGGSRVSFGITNRKKIKYKGWVNSDYLIHSPTAAVCGHNLRPVKYYAGISHPEVITKRKTYLHKDSLLMAHAPGFRKDMKGKAPLNEWLYVYKSINNPPQYLVGTEPFIDKDSLQGVFGWVYDSSLVPLPQNMVLLPKEEALTGICPYDSTPIKFEAYWTEGNQSESGFDSSRIDLRNETLLEGSDWFLPVNIPLHPKLDSVVYPVKSFAPVEMVDLRNSRIYNCLGSALTYKRYEDLQRSLHTLNLLVVFEDGEEGKEAMGNMISSFQDMYQMSRRNKLTDFKLNYGAVGYNGRHISDTLAWTKSFNRWVDFIQQRAGDTTVEYRLYEHVMLRGLQEAARMLEGHRDEHNVVMVVGSKIDAVTFEKLYQPLVKKLARAGVSLVFVQSNRGKAHNYSDFVLQSKRLLKDVARESAMGRKQMIVDNGLVRYRSEFKSEDRCGNGFLFDFPENSMAKGGVFFPQAESWMCPDVLHWVMDSIFKQIRWDTDTLLAGIEKNFRTMSRLEQEVDSTLKEILKDQGLAGMPDSLTNTFNDPFYVEVRTSLDLERPCCSPYEPAFLLREDEFDDLGKVYRKVVMNPRLDRKGDSQVDFKDRKRWARDLKRRYKERNHFFHFKGGANKATVAEIIFMETGLPVNRTFFHKLTIKQIANRNGVEMEELLPEVEYFYQDIFRMEEWPTSEPNSVVSRGDQDYFVIPAARLP